MSGTDLERLNIVLAARDREFAQAMDRNVKRIERFSKRSNRNLSATSRRFDLLGAASKRLVPLLAALSAGAVIGRLKSTVAALDDIGKTADKIGLTTDALQELRTIAESSGIGQGSLDSSLERFNKRLGEAQQGTGAAKKALDEMGISANYLAGLGLDRALSVVADEISTIEDPTRRAAMAAALFGREGVAMVNLLREGSDGMAAMRQEARELGIVIDEKLVREAEEAQTKLDLMSRVISANLSSSLINLAPLLVSAAQNIAVVTSAVRDFLSVNWELPNLMDGKQLREYAEGIEGVERELTAVNQAQAAYNANVEKYGENSKEALSWANSVTAAEKELTGALEEKRQQADAMARFQARAGQLGSERDAALEAARAREIGAEAAERERISRQKSLHIEKMMADIGGAQDSEITDGQLENVLQLVDQWEAAQIAASKILNPVKAAGGATARAKDEAMEYADVLETVAALTNGAELEGAGFARMMSEVNALLESGEINGELYADMVEQIEDQFEGAARGAKRLEDTAVNAFERMVTEGGSLKDIIGDVLGSLGSMAAKSAATGLFKNSGWFDGLGSLFSFDGGGFTGSGPRSGGLDGKGGFMAMVHPNETIIDHTKNTVAPVAQPVQSASQRTGGTDVTVRAYVDQDGNWQAAVEDISTGVSARQVAAGMAVQDRKTSGNLASHLARAG